MHAGLQAVYDTLETKDVYSRFFGGCMAGAMEENSTLAANNGEFINVGEAAAKYTVRAISVSSQVQFEGIQIEQPGTSAEQDVLNAGMKMHGASNMHVTQIWKW
jgi:hypothetical protein